MKHVAKFLFAVITTTLLYSCNGGSNPPKETTKVDSGSTDRPPCMPNPNDDNTDYYVDKMVADSMIDTFPTFFTDANLTRQFWIDTCALHAIESFLERQPATLFDGVRFCMGVNPSSGSAKSVLLVVPTSKRAAPTPTSRHADSWTTTIPLPRTCTPGDILMNFRTAGDALAKINKFGTDYRQEPTSGSRANARVDSLSISLWMNRQKIINLWTLYQQHPNLNGLMAISAAYFRDDLRRCLGERQYPIQSTLIFVPTTGANHTPDWTVVQPPPNWFKDGGFNHGQLCPQICD